jgi:lysophospholipase L1-like esterase
VSRQLFQYHPVTGYHFIPGLKCRVEHESGGYLVRVNGAGFRCEREVTPAKTPGTFRVLLFGDSFTAGDGVSNKHRYGDVLETLVPGVEVINFGLSGTGTDQQYLTFREFAAGLEYDLVVIAVLVENIRRIVAHYRPYMSAEEGERRVQAKPYFTLENGALVPHNQPVPRDPIAPEALPESERGQVDQGGNLATLRKVVNKLGLREVAQKFTRYQPVPAYDRADDPAWLLMRAILERWTRELKSPAVIMPLPLYQHVEETADSDAWRARFAELNGLQGVTVHDPFPDFVRVPLDERRGFRFEHDVHPTPAAHRLIATSLAQTVRRFVEGAKR